MIGIFLSCNLQDRSIAKLQVVDRGIAKLVTRNEHCETGSCKIGTSLRCKLQDRNIAKLQVAG